MATKTFEELKQLAIQIRDEKTNKANTATRIGTQMIEHLNKLEQEYYNIQTVDGLVSEYNVSVNHPNSGIDGSNKYTLSSAIALVPEKYRSIGLKCSFINESGEGESWEYKGGSWNVVSFSQVGDGRFTNIDNKIELTRNTEYIGADIKQREALNKCVKALYFSEKPLDNEVFVITYFTKLAVFYLGVTAYNVKTNEERVIAANNIGYEGDKVVPIYKNNEKTEIAGYTYISTKDYTIPVQNAGQGTRRMPYANDICFNLNRQPLIADYLNKEETSEDIKALKEEINTNIEGINTNIEGINTNIGNVKKNIVSIKNNVFLFQSKEIEASDIVKLNNANSVVKALYIKEKPSENNRLVLSFFAKFGSDKFQIGITSYNENDGQQSVVAATSGLTYEFDKLVEIYNNSSDKKVIGYIFASLSDYVSLISNQGEGLNRLPYFGDLCFDANKQFLINDLELKNKIADLEEKIKSISFDSVRYILIWGDSITWGSASTRNDNCYTAILRQKIIENGYIERVINCGVGGENFENILVRQGALGFYFADDVTLPASPLERIEVQRSTNYINNRKYKNTYFGENSYFQLLLQGETGRDNDEPQYKTVNPIIVNGVECTLTLEVESDGNNASYLSTNKQLDAPMLIKAGTFLYPNGSRFKGDVNIFSIGTNGGFYVKNDGIVDIDASITQYIELTDLAIEKSNSTQYIVCSPYGGSALRNLGVEGLEKLEAALTKRYGNRHFNWRKYLIEYGLSDAGIEATPEDLEAIGKGEVPPSLLSDGLHPNDYGHKVIGYRLYYMLVSLGYLYK